MFTNTSGSVHLCLSVLTLAVLTLVVGCGGESLPRDRVPVSGSVKIGNNYVDHATIVFIPVEPEDGPSASAVIEKGLFALSEDRGPLEGKLRAEIHPIGIELKEMAAQVAEGKVSHIFETEIPEKYQKHSQLLTVEAIVGETNEYEFVLDSE
ncbi:hypothetical protein Pla110_41500 [Polystyrenella longa]|uniref:Uncharacterized protein n=1 Tax=Polystyrenella longa TaxID=2528007 RepID=A0A518CT61_9PLAN|nr:hypothetical protein [Polystyrenella longa]QDU82395.1 hypothetical protein Pla110_41500 [Polystyrenella longa]